MISRLENSYFYSKQFWKPFLYGAMQFVFGVTDIKYVSHKVSDYFADYKTYEKNQENVQAPIYICNHTACCDFFILNDYFPWFSFLAHGINKKVPLISTILSTMQSIYVEKLSDPVKTKISQDQIKKREVA